MWEGSHEVCFAPTFLIVCLFFIYATKHARQNILHFLPTKRTYIRNTLYLMV